VINALITLGIPSDNILVLTGDINSTQLKAIILKTYLSKTHGIDTLLKDASADHSRSASMILKAAMK
jgi:hypothetical protein